MSSLSKSSSCSSDEDVELRRGPWTLDEDTLLTHYISSHGEGRWNLLAKRSGLRRTGKSCRLRWLNYLKPDVKRGNLSPQEQLLILELHIKWGNRWSKIAQHLPGRTDNEIKNYWRTRVQKQARHLKIDSNSTAFQELIRCFWMPLLLQKIQSNSASIDHAPPPAQLPLAFGKTTHDFDHNHVDSSKKNCNSPSIASSESMTLTQIPQVQEFWDNHDNNPFLNGFYGFDHNIETQGPAPIFGDCQEGEISHWIDDVLVDSLWNMG